MELYRKENGLTFVEEGHRYELDGKRVMNLTQILDAAGLVDYSGINPDVLANKAKFGTKVHELTLWSDKDDLDIDDLNGTPYLNRVLGWRQFVEDFNFIPELPWCEVPCAVKVNGMLYAMTIDRFGIISEGGSSIGVPAVVEIKTCADRQYHHQIQTAGQAIAFKGDGSVAVKRMAVYLLDKPNQANRLYFCQPHEERIDEKVFLSALVLTQVRSNNGLLKG